MKLLLQEYAENGFIILKIGFDYDKLIKELCKERGIRYKQKRDAKGRFLGVYYKFDDKEFVLSNKEYDLKYIGTFKNKKYYIANRDYMCCTTKEHYDHIEWVRTNAEKFLEKLTKQK